jgi:hypothetical protein
LRRVTFTTLSPLVTFRALMSVCFDNLKFWGQFLCPSLRDGSHHQSL